ncbi:AIG2 family protein [Chondrocystis sp. NIES-4102]|nr:AIG2 family protein [Chondrocystis sp. NIES-4102]
MKLQLSSLKVFVYGTLKPGEVNYPIYCGGKVKSQRTVYTYGNLYSLSLGYPAMTVGNNKVKGILLTFAESEILKGLDQLEDYQEERDNDLNLYYRNLIPIYIDDQLLGEAWAYFMTAEKVKQYHGTLVESGWWSGK